MDIRHFSIQNTVGQAEEPIPPIFRTVKTLKGRGRTPEDDRTVREFTPLLRHISCVVTRDDIRLIGIRMFFVYNQHTQFFHWGKDSGTRSNHNIGVSVSDTMPLIIAFPITQPTVQQCYPFPESTNKSRGSLRGERYLRD